MGSVNKREVGGRFEEAAAAYLKEKGYHILERNFRVRAGEIDIVAREGKYLVFVEVKYRSGGGSGYPAEAVNFRKRRQISRVALYYLTRKRLPQDTPVRFDVVAMDREKITLIRDAFPYTP